MSDENLELNETIELNDAEDIGAEAAGDEAEDATEDTE